MTYLREKYYKAGSTILSPEAIKEIKESKGKISNAAKKMSEKYHISRKRIYDLWNNCERAQQTIDNPELTQQTELMPQINDNDTASKLEMLRNVRSKIKNSNTLN